MESSKDWYCAFIESLCSFSFVQMSNEIVARIFTHTDIRKIVYCEIDLIRLNKIKESIARELCTANKIFHKFISYQINRSIASKLPILFTFIATPLLTICCFFLVEQKNINAFCWNSVRHMAYTYTFTIQTMARLIHIICYLSIQYRYKDCKYIIELKFKMKWAKKIHILHLHKTRISSISHC